MDVAVRANKSRRDGAYSPDDVLDALGGQAIHIELGNTVV